MQCLAKGAAPIPERATTSGGSGADRKRKQEGGASRRLLLSPPPFAAAGAAACSHPLVLLSLPREKPRKVAQCTIHHGILTEHPHSC